MRNRILYHNVDFRIAGSCLSRDPISHSHVYSHVRHDCKHVTVVLNELSQ